MELDPNDSTTVTALRSRFSELQTLWEATAKGDDESHYAKGTSADTGVDGGAEQVEEEPPGLSLVRCTPCKPAMPPLSSPRPFYRHVAPVTSLADGDSAVERSSATPTSASRESVASVSGRSNAFAPHTPSAPPSGTPRARVRSHASTPSLLSPVHTSPEVLPMVLPPIHSYSGPTTTCACCGALAAHVSAACCGQCGNRLATAA